MVAGQHPFPGGKDDDVALVFSGAIKDYLSNGTGTDNDLPRLKGTFIILGPDTLAKHPDILKQSPPALKSMRCHAAQLRPYLVWHNCR